MRWSGKEVGGVSCVRTGVSGGGADRYDQDVLFIEFTVLYPFLSFYSIKYLLSCYCIIFISFLISLVKCNLDKYWFNLTFTI